MTSPRRRVVYLIGSLRNPTVAAISNTLEAELGVEVFSSWAAAGPEADDYWKTYELARGRSYSEALASHAAQHVFAFDKSHLDRADAAILLLPAGRSGHLELGYNLGRGKPGWILLDDPDRWDVMYNFATGVHTDLEALTDAVREHFDL